MSVHQEETTRALSSLRKHDAPTEPIETQHNGPPKPNPSRPHRIRKPTQIAADPSRPPNQAAGTVPPLSHTLRRRAHQIGATRARTWGWEARPSAWSENPVGLAAAGGEPPPAAAGGGAAPCSAWAWAPASPGAGPPLPS